MTLSFNSLKVQNLGNISTKRLRLEPLRAAHAVVMFEDFRDPALYEWISTIQPTTTESLAESWACSGDTGPYHYGDCFGLDWALIRADDNRVIGKIDADFAADGHVINVGYVLFKSAWGQGYAKEAIGSLVAAFRTCGALEVHAYVTKGNIASASLLEGLGFCLERVIPDNDLIRGERFDDLEYIYRYGIDPLSKLLRDT
jgi:[ribosomal protein S5]-alanine N-acetyltransferase